MSAGILALSFAAALAAEGFAPVCDERGVKVWRREAAHGFELAAEGEIAASPSDVLALLADYTSHTAWVQHLAESRVLHRQGDGLVVYQRLSLPVLADRDYTLRVTWGADGSARWLRFTTANEEGPPPVEGVVRVATHEGSWRIEPLPSGGTRASYRLHIDIAGSLPAWLGKGRAAKDLPNLFEHIRARIQRR